MAIVKAIKNSVSFFRWFINHRKNTCFFLLFILLFTSCDLLRSRPNVDELSRHLDVRSIQDMFLFEDNSVQIKIEHTQIIDIDTDSYVDVVRYVPLETKDNVLIGNIDKLFFYENRIFVVDMFKSKSVFIFNDEGQFINKISRFGYKIDEYRSFRDVELDKKTKQLVLYDRNGGKMLFFDLDGEFIRTQRLSFRFLNFKIFPNGNYLFYVDTYANDFNQEIAGQSLIIGHPQGKIYFRGLPFCSFLYDLNFYAKFGLAINDCSNDYEYISPRLSNAIYHVESTGELKKLYQIHLPLGCMEEYMQHINPMHFVEEISNTEYYFSIGDRVLINDFMFYFYFLNSVRKINEIWYNRTTGKYYCIRNKFSLSGKIINVPMPLYSYNDNLIGAIDASQVVKSKTSFLEAHRTENNKDLFPEYMLEKIEAMTEDDNPLLMFYKIKW